MGGFNLVHYDGLYNKNYYVDTFNQNHFYNRKLHFRIIENGIILPHKYFEEHNGFGGVFDGEGYFVAGTIYSIGGGGPYRPVENIRYVPKTVIYLEMFTEEWGHCITDSLRRLWFLKSDLYQKYFKNCPIVCHFKEKKGGGGKYSDTQLFKVT